jgi:hypothetical protein
MTKTVKSQILDVLLTGPRDPRYGSAQTGYRIYCFRYFVHFIDFLTRNGLKNREKNDRTPRDQLGLDDLLSRDGLRLVLANQIDYKENVDYFLKCSFSSSKSGLAN